ncbi:glucose/arabinose dehydrogenase [Lysinibacillus parviboronicapiens]|uniref:Glucose/arabinose dehydrogenase n=1 Tax=Lysinibacillus parviboronicapiens TaxID=436516 RepID=A0ABV2PLH4_9BACI
MKRALVLIMLTICLLAGCTATKQQSISKEPENVDQGAGEVADVALEVIAQKLATPWSIDKVDNTFYVSERPGHIVKIVNGERQRQRVKLEKNLATASEAGLLGFVLAPDFLQSNRAYAYYTYVEGTKQFNRIIILRLEGDIWKEEQLLVDHILSGSYHHGGRLEISPDGKLYATVGDARAPSIAQAQDTLEGKILRMNLDGSIPSDNPFPNSYVYSYGHRNPQGMAWSTDGTLYASEHGNTANDEINRIKAGHNYGWPIIEGSEQQEGMIAPLFTSGNNTTWAPSGMDYYDGKLYVAALKGTAVLAFNIEKGEQRKIISGLGRIRDILVDGKYLYFISNNTDGRGFPQESDDKLYRIPLLILK